MLPKYEPEWLEHVPATYDHFVDGSLCSDPASRFKPADTKLPQTVVYVGACASGHVYRRLPKEEWIYG